MKEYFKGKLILKRDINFKKIKFNIDENDIITIVKPNYNLSGAESHVLYNHFSKVDKKFKLTDINSINIINRITYKFFKPALSEMDIIYEIITNENGEKFAKEINTGLLFPMISLNDTDLEYKIKLDNSNGSISTNLKLRDCFLECNVYLFGEEKVKEKKLEKYLKKDNEKKRNIKLNKLFNMNKFKYNIVEKKEPININKEELKNCVPYYENISNNTTNFNKPKVKIYKMN